MKRTARLFLAALGLALALGGVPRAFAGTVLVHSILEGRSTDATSAGDLVLLVVGKGLKSVDFIHLEPSARFEGLLPTVDLRSPNLSGSNLALFTDTEGKLVSGEYELTLYLKSGLTQGPWAIKLAAGGIVPDVAIPSDSFHAWVNLNDEGRIGTGSSQVARGSHNHDTAYPTFTELARDDGTPNDPADLVHWNRLKGIPADIKDGDSIGAAGDGLSLAGTTFAVAFAGTGTATTVARSDHTHNYSDSAHNHDTAYYTKSQLNASGGTLNAPTNPVDWTQLKGVPAGFADGTDADTTYTAGAGLGLNAGAFSVNFAGTGSSTSAARSDHDHNSSHYTKSELNSASGVLNASSNPLDWSQLKNVPAGFADGTDADTTYTAGTGLALNAGSFSVNFAGTGSAATSARSDHGHDTSYAAIVHNHDSRYYTQTQLNASTGTLNASSNPLDWSQLKSVPSGFADGTDDGNTYAAGAGLLLNTGAFSVDFAGTGSATTVARSDHAHDTRYYTQSQLNSTTGVINSTSNPLDWSQLKSVPAGFADGDDAGLTYSAGSGISIVSGTISVSFAGTGSATMSARSDHDHDTRYYLQAQLNATTGILNSTTNPVDWSQLKGVPAGFADGDDAGASYTAGSGISIAGGTISVNFSGTGAATTTSRSDHNHDSSYYTQAQLNSAGTINTSTNPVDWTRLKGVPSGFTDGTDDVGVYTAGTGLSLSGGAFSVNLAGTGSATTAAKSDHDHDSTYYTKSQLNATSGTINTTTNPVDWSQLKSVPSGFADGDDAGTTYTAGSGISITTGTIAVSFAGTGSAATVARSDHDHDATYLKLSGGSMTGALSVSTGSGASVTGSTSSTTGKGLYGNSTNTTGTCYGVYGEAASTSGRAVYGLSSSTSGTNYGVMGETASSSGVGVYALATSTSGASYGVKAVISNGGTAVFGNSTSTSSTGSGVVGQIADSFGTAVAGYAGSGTFTTGVYGSSGGSSGIGVHGYASSSSFSTIGVKGTSASSWSGGAGVYGTATASSGSASGVFGTCSSTSGFGVYGTGPSTSTGIGVYGTGLSGVQGVTAGTSSTSRGIYGSATGTSGSSTGVYGAAASSAGYGVYGTATNSSGTGVGVFGISAGGSGVGVHGETTDSTGSTIGVEGKDGSSSGIGVRAEAYSTGSGATALVCDLSGTSPSGNVAVFKVTGTNQARIDNNGKGYFNGGTATSGADFAESVEVRGDRGDYEPGDVMVIDPRNPRHFAKSSSGDSRLVAGVVATKPGVLARPGDVAGDDSWQEREVPLAMVGIVPVKVCDDGGSIEIGDQLVTASSPGYAKKAPAHPESGTVLGKALGELKSGRGTVEVLLGPAR